MQFLETGPELVNHYNEVIAPQDVATYGGLCALATFDRAELKASSPLYYYDDFLSKLIFIYTLSSLFYFLYLAGQSY